MAVSLILGTANFCVLKSLIIENSTDELIKPESGSNLIISLLTSLIVLGNIFQIVELHARVNLLGVFLHDLMVLPTGLKL